MWCSFLERKLKSSCLIHFSYCLGGMVWEIFFSKMWKLIAVNLGRECFCFSLMGDLFKMLVFLLLLDGRFFQNVETFYGKTGKIVFLLLLEVLFITRSIIIILL